MTPPEQYIWQFSSWPRFRWDNAVLLKPLGNCRFRQGALLARMAEMGFETRRRSRAEVMISETLKSSEIEGEYLDPDVVRSSVARRLGLPTTGSTPSKDEHADGVIDALLDATVHHDLALTTDRLFGWHSALFPTGYSGLHKIRVAAWREDRNGAMRVVSGPMGREKVHYEAPPADRIAGEMDRFLGWWGQKQIPMDGVLRAAMAHFWFVTIHPFEDGNGRIARILTEMALAQVEKQDVRYYSLSSQIMARRDSYYKVLERSARGKGDITEWMVWFLECLCAAILKTEDLLSNVLLKHRFWKRHARTGLKERQCKVINRLLEAGPGGFEGGLTNRKYAGMAHVSRSTAQRELADLVQKGILSRNPHGGRSVGYDLCWEEPTDSYG